MQSRQIRQVRLARFPDVLLPLSFLAASLLGREYAALLLFFGVFSSGMCALASANGLRNAFAGQPSMRLVQGSVVMSLCLQPMGGLIAAVLLRKHIPFIFFASGTLLNIEHVFYEYLYTTGDEDSAILCRILTAILNLTGLLLSFPPAVKTALPASCEPGWLAAIALISALVALIIGMVMGGPFKPKLNAEILRVAPVSLLQTALYPALAAILLRLFLPYARMAPPLFSGLCLYEYFRTPFRRSPLEVAPMNRALLICCAAAALCSLSCRFFSMETALSSLPPVCSAIVLAALCLFVLFGNISRREDGVP